MNTPRLPVDRFSVMTVRQVADSLGVDCRTINRHVSKLYPGKAINGVASYLNEAEVTEIKRAIERSGRNDLDNVVQVAGVTTDLEMMVLDRQVAEWKNRKITELQAQLQAAQPAIESHGALMRSEKTMSVTDAAKHFGLHPRTEVFPYLRERGYLTMKDLPTQAAIDAGILALIENKDRYSDTLYPQAVVRACQLEKWRTVVVPNIHKWKAE